VTFPDPQYPVTDHSSAVLFSAAVVHWVTFKDNGQSVAREFYDRSRRRSQQGSRDDGEAQSDPRLTSARQSQAHTPTLRGVVGAAIETVVSRVSNRSRRSDVSANNKPQRSINRSGHPSTDEETEKRQDSAVTLASDLGALSPATSASFASVKSKLDQGGDAAAPTDLANTNAPPLPPPSPSRSQSAMAESTTELGAPFEPATAGSSVRSPPPARPRLRLSGLGAATLHGVRVDIDYGATHSPTDRNISGAAPTLGNSVSIKSSGGSAVWSRPSSAVRRQHSGT
jgi:hypothetical protein